MSTPVTITAEEARHLLLGAQGLLAEPRRRSGAAQILRIVCHLGYVQVDTINVVGRAHDLILHSRADGYRPDDLATLLEKERSLFEHWTHDAAVIPSAWYTHWKPRFRSDRPVIRAHPWWQKLLGEDGDAVCAEVLSRIRREGPLRSADFDHPEPRTPWWGWKPAKAALDYLWRTGELAVAGRAGFQKIYDLAERVFPTLYPLPEPEPEAHAEWVHAEAAERLVIFTPRELAAFWDALSLEEARAWCDNGVGAGRLVRARVASADGTPPQNAFALADWTERLAILPPPPNRIRLLCPFDPVLRDRLRCSRRFGFDYRCEVFTPAPKRVYGYYVMPLLERDRLVGRLDAKLHRDRSVLEVRGLWWEKGVKQTKARRRMLGEALERLAAFSGAERGVESAPSAPALSEEGI